ncbi:6-hydroxy-3-succinoylpyridine 3-monooxygenase HspB [Pseudomonas sp. 58 R 3]|nr:6-hydroxy-3-succinoylpyridine 3-monooxygenase HspB [Pseudomonas sp. 58 R 3]
MSELSNDVIIVGAGPVGLLTALALAQEGMSVTVIESEPEIPATPRAPVYFPSTITVLEKLGLLEDLKQISSMGTGFAQFYPDLKEVVRLNTSVMNGITYPYNLHLGQDTLAKVVLRHAEKLGVKVLFSHQFEQIVDNTGSVTINLSTPEGAKSITADWLIGADGARSAVRNGLDIEFEGTTWPVRFVAANIRADLASCGYSDANFVTHPTDHAVVVLMDRKTNLWRIAYSEDAELDPENVEDRFEANCARPFIAQGVPYELVQLRQYRLHQRAAATFRTGRVFLAGDAAHATSPVGGLGLSCGIWDGMILADVLSAVIRGEEDEDILNRYATERRRVFWEVASPGAVENMRVLMEGDVNQRRKDLENARVAAGNPKISQMVMLFAFKLIGDTLRAGSRWADADPTPAAGIDLTLMNSQTGDHGLEALKTQ